MPGLNPAPAELDVLNNLSNTVLELYTNDLSANPAPQLSDLVFANFDGYQNAAPPNWANVETDEETLDSLISGSVITFTKAAGTISNTVRGYAVILVTTAGPYLLGIKKFPAPVLFFNPGDSFSFAPEMLVTDDQWPA